MSKLAIRLGVYGVVAFLLFTSAVEAQQHVGFIPPGPGLNAPLNDDAEAAGYGNQIIESGTWVCDGDACTAGPNDPNLSAALSFNVTLQDDTVEAKMDMTNDWYFEVEFKHSGDFGGEWPFFLKDTVLSDAKILHLRHVGGVSDDTWELWAADSNPNPFAGGWAKVADAAPLGSDYNNFLFHYKAGSQTIDAYQNGVLFAPDFTLGHGDYAPSLLNLEWSRAPDSTDTFRFARLGQILVPEPGSIALLLFGLTIGCTSRGRCVD